MNALGGIGFIEGIEVDAVHIMVEQITTLFRCPVHPYVGNAFGIAIAPVQCLEQCRREYGSACKVGHSIQTIDA